MMDEEREMCQNCKKDIPIEHYRSHTLQCAKNMVKCRDCDSMVGKNDMENHRIEFHTLRLCTLCNVNVEAYKLPEHKKTLCSKRKLPCKFCSQYQLASDMSDHELRCGMRSEKCMNCHEFVELKDWDSHQNRYHGQLVQRFRERSVIASMGPEDDYQQTRPMPQNSDEDNPMLPCEFCEGLIPMRKLLEHQAECVNPTNVRRSESISNLSQLPASSLSSYRPLSAIRHLTHSNTNSLQRTTNSLQRKISAPSRFCPPETPVQNGTRMSDQISKSKGSQHEEKENISKLPCEFCSEPQDIESLMKHQRSCEMNPNNTDSKSGYDSLRGTKTYGISRTASAREARATTEDRTFGRSISRQSSFTERSYSRRSDMYSSQMYTRGNLGLGRFTAGPDYAAATRRSALFDGYTGFAIYSSISQGLDEITYGGRRSRRNSITDSNYSFPRRGSVSGPSYEYSSLVSATATANATMSNNRYLNPTEPLPTFSSAAKESSESGVSNSPKSSTTLSRQDSTRYSSSVCQSDSAYETLPPSAKSLSNSASTSSGGVLSTNSGGAISRQESLRHSKSSSKVERKVSFSGADPVLIEALPLKPKRHKEKQDKERKKKVDMNKHCDDILDQVSAKLRAFEQLQNDNEDEDYIDFDVTPESPLSRVPPSTLFPSNQSSQAKVILPLVPMKVAEVSQANLVSMATSNNSVSITATLTLNGTNGSVKFKDMSTDDPTKEPDLVRSFGGQRSIATTDTNDNLTKLNLKMPTSPRNQLSPSYDNSQDISPNKQATQPSYTQTLPSYGAKSTFQSSPNYQPYGKPPTPNYPYHETSLHTFDQQLQQLEQTSCVKQQATQQSSVPDKNDVVYREKGRPESKAGSKRNSLDNKTVQSLAQDLAAECAKAYALMESSLSKLSTDFAVGPFGLTPKIKKTRKSRSNSTAPLK